MYHGRGTTAGRSLFAFKRKREKSSLHSPTGNFPAAVHNRAVAVHAPIHCRRPLLEPHLSYSQLRHVMCDCLTRRRGRRIAPAVLPPLQVAVVGGPCGKTLLLRRLLHCNSDNTPPFASFETRPTTGVELEMLRISGSGAFILREVGSALRAVWPSYLAAADAVIIVADASDASALAELAVTVWEVARQGHGNPPRSRPVLIVFNRTDVATCVSGDVVSRQLRLDDLRGGTSDSDAGIDSDSRGLQPYTMVWTSCVTGAGLGDVHRWLRSLL